jgi:hypothetical protein
MKNSELVKEIETLGFRVKECKEVWCGPNSENREYCQMWIGDILLRISPVQEEARASRS